MDVYFFAWDPVGLPPNVIAACQLNRVTFSDDKRGAISCTMQGDREIHGKVKEYEEKKYLSQVGTVTYGLRTDGTFLGHFRVPELTEIANFNGPITKSKIPELINEVMGAIYDVLGTARYAQFPNVGTIDPIWVQSPCHSVEQDVDPLLVIKTSLGCESSDTGFNNVIDLVPVDINENDSIMSKVSAYLHFKKNIAKARENFLLGVHKNYPLFEYSLKEAMIPDLLNKADARLMLLVWSIPILSLFIIFWMLIVDNIGSFVATIYSTTAVAIFIVLVMATRFYIKVNKAQNLLMRIDRNLVYLSRYANYMDIVELNLQEKHPGAKSYDFHRFLMPAQEYKNYANSHVTSWLQSAMFLLTFATLLVAALTLIYVVMDTRP